MSNVAQHTAQDFRAQIDEYADRYGLSKDELLFQSPSRDPLNKGTPGDHAKARWFADLWERAIDNRDADTIHIRGLHYVIVQLDEDIEPPGNCDWERYTNTNTCYGYLTDAGAAARVLGYVPMGGIADEKNTQDVVTRYEGHAKDAEVSGKDAPDAVDMPEVPAVDDTAQLRYESPEQYADRVADHVAGRVVKRITLDTATQQPYHVELWSEKALPDAVKRAARDEGVDAIVEGEGHLSYRVAHDFVDRVEDAGKDAVVFYLTDFDPAGETMPAAMASKVSWLDLADQLTHEVTLSRLAVTADQVDQYDLPREPVDVDAEADAYATLADEWEDEHNGGAVELSALEADLDHYCRIVTDGIATVTDDTLVERNRRRKRQLHNKLADELRDEFADADLAELYPQLRELTQQFNDELDEVAETLDRLGELQNKAILDEWRNRVNDACDAVELPTLDAPAGEAPTPPNPLYDSRRTYLDNLRAIRGDDEVAREWEDQRTLDGFDADGEGNA